MTRDETKELLMTIRAIYPNFNVKTEEMTPVINAWHLMLEDYPAQDIGAALRIYVKTNNTGFAPSVSQLIGSMNAVKVKDTLTEGEAWALVKKAISDSYYNAVERYAELPEIIQRAVGSANILHQWASIDSHEVNTVVMSNFQRSYRALCEKQEFTDKVGKELQLLTEKPETLMIGESNGD